MITAWDVYWVTRLDSIGAICTLLACIFFIGGAAACFFGTMEDEEEWVKKGKKFMLSGIIPCLLAVFVPSSKEYAAIYLIPKMANSNSAKHLSDATDNATLLLKLKFEEWAKDALVVKKK